MEQTTRDSLSSSDWLRQKLDQPCASAAEFLADLSLAMRVPVNSILGATARLVETDLTGEQRECAQRVCRSAETLLTLINDVLDFARIDSGEMMLDAIDFDLRATLESVTALLAEHAHAQAVEVICLVHHDLPTVLRADPTRLRQVLVSLLRDAIDSTKKGKVVLRAKLAAETDRTARIRFEVREAEDGVIIDQSCWRIEPSGPPDILKVPKLSDARLGLVIAKKLAERMGSTIGIERGRSASSMLWFLVETEKVPERVLGMPPPRQDLRALRVLVGDHNEDHRKSLLAQILSWGMTCDIATSAAQTIQMMWESAQQGSGYDLAILDAELPGMNGLELVHTINSDPALAAVRLVLMAPGGLRGQGEESRKAGITGYLSKPVDQAQLYECLATVMAASGERVAGTAAIVTAHKLQEAKSHNRARVLVAEDNEVNQIWTVRTLKKLGIQTDVAASGREAVQACQRNRYDLVLMNCQMPEMDGFEATREIRRVEATRGGHVPIVALTAGDAPSDVESCLAAGMDEYAMRPITATKLRETLAHWIRQPLSQEPAQDQRTSASDARPIDSEVLDDLRQVDDAGPGDFLTQLIESFLHEAQLTMAAIQRAVEQADGRALQQAAHSLRGGSLTMGAKTMGTLCAELEASGRNGTLDHAPRVLQSLQNEFGRVQEALHAELRK